MLFGRGIVSTPEDFGSQGALPSHPQLLDWLASDLSRIGLGLEAPTMKQMLMSATYRQTATVNEQKWMLDPDNVLVISRPANAAFCGNDQGSGPEPSAAYWSINWAGLE